MKPIDFIKEDFVTDAHDVHQDHEVQMARADCYNAAKYAIELHKMLKNISEQQGLEGWVSEKITVANDYLRTVHEYLTYEQHSQAQAMPGFDPKVAEMYIESVVEAGRGSNRGYEPGFASPTAPSLAGRRQNDEPDAVNNIEVSINGRPWKVFAGVGPNSSRAFFQQKQKVADMCKRKTAETGKEWTWGVTGAPATNESDDANIGNKAALLTPSPQAAQQAKDIVQKQADANVIGQAKIAGAVPVKEKAPPGAKAERMVKHIKKGYADDGKLTKKEKSIAYATAWKEHNKDKVEEMAVGMGAGSVATSMGGGNGFANGGPGTISRARLKKAKK